MVTRRLGRLRGALEHQRAQSRHGARALALLAGWKLSGGEVLEAEERQLKAVLDTHLLEQPRKVHLHGAFGDHQGSGDLLVLEPLRQQADQLALALRESHAASAQEAVGEGL